MADRDDGRERQSVTPETLAAAAALRGIPVDAAFLEELTPLVIDMFALTDGIARWLERQEGVPAGGGLGGVSGA